VIAAILWRRTRFLRCECNRGFLNRACDSAARLRRRADATRRILHQVPSPRIANSLAAMSLTNGIEFLTRILTAKCTMRRHEQTLDATATEELHPQRATLLSAIAGYGPCLHRNGLPLAGTFDPDVGSTPNTSEPKLGRNAMCALQATRLSCDEAHAIASNGSKRLGTLRRRSDHEDRAPTADRFSTNN
jgi:hypothetical protein